MYVIHLGKTHKLHMAVSQRRNKLLGVVLWNTQTLQMISKFVCNDHLNVGVSLG